MLLGPLRDLQEKMNEFYDFGENFYSVDEVTDIISNLIEGDPYLDRIWVIGEVANSKLSKNTLYFNLVGESSRLPCVLFGAGNFKLADGEIVSVYGSIRVYKKGGRYNFHVKNVERTGTYGMKSIKFAKLYQKLLKEGVLNRPKRTLGDFPYRIGLIVSKRSAAFFDILRTFKTSGYYFEIEVFDTFVQGERAPEELVRAFENASKSELDAVIVARGGGSKDELWTFNDEAVVRSATKLPHYLITGIGHEIDSVILDMVADERAHTPTAAAEVITSKQKEFVEKMMESIERISNSVSRIFEEFQDELKTEVENISEHVEEILKDYENRLRDIGKNLRIHLNLVSERVTSIFRSIEGRSPEKVLKMGYSMVLKNGNFVKSISRIEKGDRLKIILRDGIVEVTADEIVGNTEET